MLKIETSGSIIAFQWVDKRNQDFQMGESVMMS